MNQQELRQADPQVAAAIGEELGRQRHKIELIASENFVSPAVMEAMGMTSGRHRRCRIVRRES